MKINTSLKRIEMDNNLLCSPQHLRFLGFEGISSWEEKRMGDIFVRITKKNKENNKTVLTISAQYGLVSQYDYFNKNVASLDVSNYYLIEKGDFAYNKSRSQGYPYGAIKPLSLYDKGVVSPLYICFRLKENGGNADFFRHYFETDLFNNEIAKIAQEGARNHGLLNISSEEFFNIQLRVPSIEEQSKIAMSLSSIDELINASNEKLELLKAHKKGLMQQLLTSINGGGNSNRPLEELFEIRNGYTPSKADPNYWENGLIPWFRMEDIRKNGHILSDAIQHVTPSAVKGKGLFPAYSIIVATTATIGIHALIIVDSLANQQFTFLSKRKSFEDKLDMMYFHYYMFLVDEWCKNNTNSGGLLSVNMSAFKRLMIPLPPINEQKKIANVLSSSDKVIDRYSDRIEMLRRHKRALMQQLFPQA